MASPRTAARRHAVELVFEAFGRDMGLLDLLRSRAAIREAAEQDADRDSGEETKLPDAAVVAPYTLQLVRGVASRQGEISDWLDTYSKGWPQSRMPAVDRAILYVGAYEIVFEDDVPDPVTLKAAADMAGKLSTDKSANFVSGLLGRLSKLKPTLL